MAEGVRTDLGATACMCMATGAAEPHARLQELVAEMTGATGQEQIAVMAKLLTAMVADHVAMHAKTTKAQNLTKEHGGGMGSMSCGMMNAPHPAVVAPPLGKEELERGDP
jgi:hypothetical protein